MQRLYVYAFVYQGTGLFGCPGSGLDHCTGEQDYGPGGGHMVLLNRGLLRTPARLHGAQWLHANALIPLGERDMKPTYAG
ncbi:unnamed protein product [Merluccius merluccius]